MAGDRKAKKARGSAKGATRSGFRDEPPRRKLGRSFLRLLKWLLLVSVCTGGAFFAREYWLLWLGKPVSDVFVSGEFTFISKARVETKISSAIGEGFLKLDLDVIRLELERDPWVDRAAVKRRWPSTLEVVIVEHKPIARWGSKSVLNHRGEIIHLPLARMTLEQLKILPQLQGPETMAQSVMKQYQSLMQVLSGSGLQIAELRLSDTRNWDLKTNGVTVNLGRDRIMEKIGMFLLVYEQELKAKWNTVVSVDLRYKSGVAVAWKDKETAGAKN